MNREGARPADEERTVVVSLSRARTQVSATSFWEEAPTTGTARSARPATPSDYVDRAVGGFRLVELLGSGAMGAVYKAEKNGRTVALKLLAPQLARMPELRRRFLREGRIQEGMRHPNIVPVIETGQDVDLGYIAMELLTGGSLADLLRARGRLPEDEARQVFHAVLTGLIHAHEQGYVHRDIKPDNVMLDGRGRVALSDFGLAGILGGGRDSTGTATEGTAAGLTQTGAIVGTPAYIAPEQIQGREADHRSDLYSLGCLMFRTLTGSLPFPGPTITELFEQHVKSRASPVSRFVAVTDDLDAIVLRLLDKDPRRRFAVAGEDLRVIEEGYLEDPVLGIEHARMYRNAMGGRLEEGFVAKTLPSDQDAHGTELRAATSARTKPLSKKVSLGTLCLLGGFCVAAVGLLALVAVLLSGGQPVRVEETAQEP
ncbi:MAG: serine/threonine protein kinase [Planctomycetes bacterium]|nr:serine/threonine protein kinase [Planctomycetota bacterium]